MVPSLRIVLALSIAAFANVANAAPSTLTVLTDGELDASRVEAIRAEAAVRGLHVEIVSARGSDALATALGERPDIAAVLWSDGPLLRVRAPDGRVAHAPLYIGVELTPRVFAAIASSLIDDLVLAAMPAVRVNVDVHVGSAGAPQIVERPIVEQPVLAPGAVVAVGEPARPAPWYLDVGGLAAPGGIYEAHLGVGRYVSEVARAAVIGHFVRVPGGFVGAGTLELSRTWGHRVRVEAGGLAIGVVNINDDVDCDGGECMDVWSTSTAFGVGGFFGVGLRAAWGTLYTRAGVAFVGSTIDDVSTTPTGSLGVELPL